MFNVKPALADTLVKAASLDVSAAEQVLKAWVGTRRVPDGETPWMMFVTAVCKIFDCIEYYTHVDTTGHRTSAATICTDPAGGCVDRGPSDRQDLHLAKAISESWVCLS
jgi:hypothetical protein